MNILIIGGGNMGLAYARTFLKAHHISPSHLMILERSTERRLLLEQMNIGTPYSEPNLCVEKAKLIVFATKPQDVNSVFSQIKPYVNVEQIIFSVMAGVRIAVIKSALSLKKIVRAMPNLPLIEAEGMTVYTSSQEVSRGELTTIQNLIHTSGKSIYTDNESMLDAATAISGSGPAYVFYFMQAMEEQAQQLGFSLPEAELLVSQTFLGAIQLLRKSSFSCQEWIDKVSSKGGTTEAAIRQFEEDNMTTGFKKAIEAAHERAKQLSTKD